MCLTGSAERFLNSTLMPYKSAPTLLCPCRLIPTLSHGHDRLKSQLWTCSPQGKPTLLKGQAGILVLHTWPCLMELLPLGRQDVNCVCVCVSGWAHCFYPIERTKPGESKTWIWMSAFSLGELNLLGKLIWHPSDQKSNKYIKISPSLI